ncbi:MAG TPA: methionyl-tRNA formyltransferase [Patescibacteria group bacterium]|nr:methionyl-tRNA formyltransferase [Patescibacteria group bacterium]
MTPVTVIVAGSTARTTQIANCLIQDSRFTVSGIITPSPKPIGRKQALTKNPLHEFAITNDISVALVEKKLDDAFHQSLVTSYQPPDFLLVVDFGYIVPQWLLDFPEVAPLNIHPSALPKYRGSSPGQFALLFGEKESAVTLMVMDTKLDHGPIVAQWFFAIDPQWTATDYYKNAFDLACAKLPDLLSDLELQTTNSQPDESPTPTARMLKREDGFVSYQTLQELLSGKPATQVVGFLEHYGLPTTNYQLYCLWRGFHPWPGLWTFIPENTRMKLIHFHMDGEKLILDEVQLEGKGPTRQLPLGLA